MSKFVRGVSGNTSGRPSGIPDKRTELRMLMLPHAEKLVQKVIDLALEGDMHALRLCIERLVPRIRDETVKLKIPDLDFSDSGNLVAVGAVLLKTVSDGAITPEQGKSIASILDAQRKSIEICELTRRIAEVEHALKIRKSP